MIMKLKTYRCKSCGKEIEIRATYHAGFNEVGYLYCSNDDTVLTFSVYDPVYKRLVRKSKAPDELNKSDQKRIEKQLIGCDCGGTFSFNNQLKCPICKGVLAEPISKDIHYIILRRIIDGEEVNVWKSE